MILCCLVALIFLAADGVLGDSNVGDSSDGVLNIRLSDRPTYNCSGDSSNSKLDSWILIHRRIGRPTEFQNGTWNDYKNGFGTYGLNSSVYWMGLEKMHKYTSDGNWELLVSMRFKTAPQRVYVIYKNFKVDSELFQFTLHVGPKGRSHSLPKKYLDLLEYCNHEPFSTLDSSNAKASSCVHRWGGGWWFNSCYRLCLTCKSYDLVAREKEQAIDSFMAIRKVWHEH